MAVEDLEFTEIAALCRTVLSSEEVEALDQAIMAEAMTELSRLSRYKAPAAPGAPIRRQLPKRQRTSKIKLVGS